MSEGKIENDYVESLKKFFKEVINSDELSFEDIDFDEMFKYLFVLEVISISLSDTGTVTFFVNCNDLFVWGCSDAEPITWDEIPQLFKMCLEDSRFGSQKWCCKKVDRKPQRPYIELMKKNNAWELWMDNLKDSIKY